jgi:signal transduction histidine kinase
VRLRSLLARRGIDASVVALAVAAQVEVWLDESQTPRAVTAPAALLWTLPLLLRHRSPLGAPLVVFAVLTGEALAADDAVTSSQVNGIALLMAFAVVGANADLRSALAGAAVGYAGLATIILNDHPAAEGTVPILILAAVAWAIGRTLGERGRRADALAERADRLERQHESAVAEERARIARELHDVIAHSVSVMTVQAGAARMLLEEDPERAREPLLAVEETGRQALGEMRRLLGILRGDDGRAALAPQPSLARVESLAEQVRTAGLPVDLHVEGEPRPLPPGIDLAAYRVVQEALTNALKHAGAARARVNVRYLAGSLELAVVNDGRTPRNGAAGHGLVGMEERIALYGGEFDAGPRSDGGFAVRATLPLPGP